MTRSVDRRIEPLRYLRRRACKVHRHVASCCGPSPERAGNSGTAQLLRFLRRSDLVTNGTGALINLIALL
jgi:hypothetical protein